MILQQTESIIVKRDLGARGIDYSSNTCMINGWARNSNYGGTRIRIKSRVAKFYGSTRVNDRDGAWKYLGRHFMQLYDLGQNKYIMWREK